MNSILHIYGQGAWHDDINIHGNRKALEDLRDSLNAVLEIKSKGNSFIHSFVNDGEGFTLYFHLMNDKETDNLPVPYTDEIAKGN